MEQSKLEARTVPCAPTFQYQNTSCFNLGHMLFISVGWVLYYQRLRSVSNECWQLGQHVSGSEFCLYDTSQKPQGRRDQNRRAAATGRIARQWIGDRESDVQRRYARSAKHSSRTTSSWSRSGSPSRSHNAVVDSHILVKQTRRFQRIRFITVRRYHHWGNDHHSSSWSKFCFCISNLWMSV